VLFDELLLCQEPIMPRVISCLLRHLPMLQVNHQCWNFRTIYGG
jgi:hypothetical protein